MIYYMPGTDTLHTFFQFISLITLWDGEMDTREVT